MQSQIGEGELQFLLSEAGNKKGATIELPFQPGRVVFMLTVKLAGDNYEPMWTYYEGDDQNAKVLWQHPTGDIYLLLNLMGADAMADNYTAAGPGSIMANAPNKTHGSIDTSQRPQQEFSPTTTQQLPQPMNGMPTAKQVASVEGDLSNMQIPTLLQSINMSKMTGKLMVNSQSSQAWIFFDDGTPTHAVTAETTGDQAIVEMITWEEGQFHFYPNDKATEKTVKKRVDNLLMEGITLLDQNKFLKDRGLKSQSYLARKHASLTEDEFKSALGRGAPLDLATQKKFYSSVDNGSTLLELLRRVPMIKNEWVPIMFNMISCDLLTISDEAPAGVAVAPVVSVPPFDIDRTAVQGVVRALTRQETGIFSYPAFLYFIEQEFIKCHAMGMPLSVMVFEPALRVGDTLQPMPMQFVREMLRRIENLKRPFDVMGHFETFDYAMFLPNASSKSAKLFAVQLMQALANDSFIPRPAGQLSMTFGIASAPEDTHELPTLLSAAKDAKVRGREAGSMITAFKELNPR